MSPDLKLPLFSRCSAHSSLPSPANVASAAPRGEAGRGSDKSCAKWRATWPASLRTLAFRRPWSRCCCRNLRYNGPANSPASSSDLKLNGKTQILQAKPSVRCEMSKALSCQFRGLHDALPKFFNDMSSWPPPLLGFATASLPCLATSCLKTLGKKLKVARPMELCNSSSCSSESS